MVSVLHPWFDLDNCSKLVQQYNPQVLYNYYSPTSVEMITYMHDFSLNNVLLLQQQFTISEKIECYLHV